MSPRNLSLVLSAQNTLRITLAYASPAAALTLRLLPRLAKIIAYLVLILNVRSLPFGWHSMLIAHILVTRFLFFFVFPPNSHRILASHQDQMARMVCPHAYSLPLLRGS